MHFKKNFNKKKMPGKFTTLGLRFGCSLVIDAIVQWILYVILQDAKICIKTVRFQFIKENFFNKNSCMT
jgi:hypothetical protein